VRGVFYLAPAPGPTGAASIEPAAAAAVARMERTLAPAIRAEVAWAAQHAGAEHPVFQDPLGAIGVFGLLLRQAREAGARDRARIAALDAVEQRLVDRLCAVAEEHPKVR
jgi:hypothetical protein